MDWGPFAPPVLPKKARKTITLEIQKSVWDVHIGTGLKEAPCPLCGEHIIKSPTARCGLECAHIIAEKFFVGTPSALSLYPSCASCNNSCREECILDFLFRTGRHAHLETLIRAVHGRYLVLNPFEPPERLMMHAVIDILYGWERYKAGGGIYNDVEIYHFARAVHMKQLNEEMAALIRQVNDKAKEIQGLSLNVPVRKRPPTVI